MSNSSLKTPIDRGGVYRSLPIILLISAALGGCYDDAPKRSDVVGVWKGPNGEEIDISKDGVARLINIEKSYLFGPSESHETISPRLNIDGTWRLSQPEGSMRILNPIGWWTIKVGINNNNKYYAGDILVGYSGGTLFLREDMDSGPSLDFSRVP